MKDQEHGNMSHESSRREFVKKAAYVAPVILSLSVQPSYAGVGSPGCERGEGGHGWHGRGNHGRGNHGRGNHGRAGGRGDE
jgi:hypothetical protein